MWKKNPEDKKNKTKETKKQIHYTKKEKENLFTKNT